MGIASVLWHPHQKLWNRELVRRLRRFPGGRIAIRGVRIVDSLLLVAGAVTRRAQLLGVRSTILPPTLPPKLFYIDCGTHKSGNQIKLMNSWFGNKTDLVMIGIEASPDHMKDVQESFAGTLTVNFQQQALVGPDYSESTVRLYKDSGSGLGDSLFAERGTQYDDVPASRLTDLMERLGIDPARVPTILRMNIEGAEFYVVQDLVAAGIDAHIAGFYGMWDDLSKIDLLRDAEFRRVLSVNDINPMTFNDRDAVSKLRMWAIRYDIGTSCRAWSPVHDRPGPAGS